MAVSFGTVFRHRMIRSQSGPADRPQVESEHQVIHDAQCPRHLARALHTLEFKGGLMDSNALSAADVQAIARLPAREVLHAQLVGTIAAPLSGLVRGLNALIAGLAIQLKAIADQGLVSGEAPAAAPEQAREDEPTAAATPETVNCRNVFTCQPTITSRSRRSGPSLYRGSPRWRTSNSVR